MSTRTKLFTLLFLFLFESSFSQSKHALIVAIGNYPEPETNGWPVISSGNDVPLIKNALINQQCQEQPEQ